MSPVNLDDLIPQTKPTLENLAEITSNRNRQVQLNPAMLSQFSRVVTNTDALVPG